ncbi:MAG: ThuA domain-containing protein [Clostridia bacterium]|nr:ThuA domain-containing protein [Clostridia bacterium]
MNVLVLCGDEWHPAEVVIRGLKGLEQEGFVFDFVEDAKDILTPEMLKRYDVIMNCKSDDLTNGNVRPWFDKGVTEVMPSDFEAWVREGGGFLSVHAGAAFYEDDASGYKDFLGCWFIRHPPRCTVEVRMCAEHPVMQGVEDFTIRDEHYQLGLCAQDLTMLCTTHSESGGDQVGGYVKEMGAGRVCMLAPGHILSVWEHPQYRKMLVNALRWCAGDK